MKKLLILLVAAMFLAACGSSDDEEVVADEDVDDIVDEMMESYTPNSKGVTYNSEQKDKEDPDEEDPEIEYDEIEEVIEEEEEIDDTQDNIDDIDYEVNHVIDEDLDNTTVTDLRINEDVSVDEERYIVLADVEWDVKNSESTTKDMLDMYSDHLAANLTDNELIYELVLFWTVPYHNEDESILKRTYENKEDGMYLEDEVKDITVFN